MRTKTPDPVPIFRVLPFPAAYIRPLSIVYQDQTDFFEAILCSILVLCLLGSLLFV